MWAYATRFLAAFMTGERPTQRTTRSCGAESSGMSERLILRELAIGYSFPAARSARADECLGRDDLQMDGKPEAPQHRFAVLPHKPEGPDIGYAKAADNIADSIKILFLELAFHHRRLRPPNEIGKCDLMAKVGRQLLGDGSPRDHPTSPPNPNMPPIRRKLFVNLGEFPLLIVDFLTKSGRVLLFVHFLDVPCQPSASSPDIQPVAPTSRRKLLPISELPLVLPSAIPHLLDGPPCRLLAILSRQTLRVQHAVAAFAKEEKEFPQHHPLAGGTGRVRRGMRDVVSYVA